LFIGAPLALVLGIGGVAASGHNLVAGDVPPVDLPGVASDVADDVVPDAFPVELPPIVDQTSDVDAVFVGEEGLAYVLSILEAIEETAPDAASSGLSIAQNAVGSVSPPTGDVPPVDVPVDLPVVGSVPTDLPVEPQIPVDPELPNLPDLPDLPNPPVGRP
jgi:hypothetical protein